MKTKKLFIIFITMAVLLSSSAFTNVTFSKTIDKKEDIIVGAATQKTWTFEANKSGTYTIEFKYFRSWEKDTSASKTVEYSVKVTDEVNTDSTVVSLINGKENTVKKGQKFSITLEENPSTGYSWSYDIKDNGITFINTKEEPRIGAPLNKMWTFEANKSGTYKIVFTYSRPWEKNNSTLKTVEYKIKVKNKNNSKVDSVALTKGKLNYVDQNQKFSITLKENASTGYSWSYKANMKVIKLISEDIVNEDGAPTQKMWTFKADQIGTYKIVFSYRQPWVKDTAALKTIEYLLKVTDDNNADSSSVALTEGKENIITKGQKFFISLEENASTGYSWEYSVIGNGIKLIK